MRKNSGLQERIEGLDEPSQAVPLTLYRRVTRGIRIAAWRQREETRFKYGVSVWLGALVLAAAAFVTAVASTHFGKVLENGVSGGRGWLDYYSTALNVSLSGYTGAYSLLGAILIAGGTLLLGLAPLSRFLRGH